MMEQPTWYLPQGVSTKRTPIVIGLPGFAHTSERTRIDNLLDKLKKCGIAGVRVNYPGIIAKEEGNVIECNFNLQAYIQSAKDAREEAIHRDDIDASRIGLLDSSMGSGIAGHWLAKDAGWNPLCKVSVSPLAGWLYYGSREARAFIQNSEKDIDIRSAIDKKFGISRYIPRTCLQEIMQTDALTALENNQRTSTFPVLTIIGTQDEEASGDSMRAFHYAFANEAQSTLREWDSGHAVPEKRYEREALRFFKKHLLNNQ